MHDLNFRDMTKEQIAEESLIDLAYAILEDKKQAMPLNDLLKEIQALNGISNGDLKARLVQFYTDLNVEGRFLLNNENGWGLREWYKVETIEEETAPTIKARKKKSKATDDEDEDLVDLDEEDVVFDEDFDEFIEEEEEDIEFVEEEIEDIDTDLDEELIDEEESFIIEGEDDDEDEEDEEEEDEEDLK
ncbi:DNA-directed RNA polymerase subunit delta [Solibacillus sp. R5-41]|uniref:DNA-directed RNA polymerase subunit delta n=1 Tax=Solibacillus sp. R5-41 TaxID=2048654 RepID=UPI000C12866C|nr:DNA-directed RNA polymerase subunit delta [Solibacillus sp. R5-41]ATP42346.1 DNA-directed RNA polymerase subunit delta [Solibacillus sp. R5-41]